MLRLAEGVRGGPKPEDTEPGHRCRHEHDERGEQGNVGHRCVEEPGDAKHEGADHETGNCRRPCVHGDDSSHGYPLDVQEPSYSSGDDYVVEFLGHRFSFNAFDFEQRVTAAAVRLGLVEGNDLDADETADLVELTADGRISEPRSGLGLYLVRYWEQLSLVGGESLVYWLRKLVFRGAWLDHRVKEGLLEIAWDDERADFGYRDPRGDRALLELAPVPSWHALQFRR